MDRLLEDADTVIKKYPCLKASAQIGPSSFQSGHIKATQWLDAFDFDRAVKMCDVFISHAGMGNILLAEKYNKPIIIMPRRTDLGEHTNDHQLATADALQRSAFIHVVNNAQELEQMLVNILEKPQEHSSQSHSNKINRENLIEALKGYLTENERV